MLTAQRILFSDDGTIVDKSSDLNNFRRATSGFAVVAAEDYLYVGSSLPFVNRYFDIGVANDQASVLSVEIWTGNDWESAVDVRDETSVGGVSLARSGLVQWTTDYNSNWVSERTSEDVTGLSTVNIYDFYWVRFSWGSDLGAGTTLNYIGHRFCDDDDLATDYPDLNRTNVKTGFESGKTDWKEQGIRASEDIIFKLNQKRVIINGNQIFDPYQFKSAAVHKLAAIIMRGFGEQYGDRLAAAEAAYESELNSASFSIDRDRDGHLEELEVTKHHVGLSRV